VDVDDLYGLPLDRFTPERNALAKELRQGGRRDEATEVAALRKPSVAAWAVNQLVRTQKQAIGELFAAGDDLRDAQDAVLSGRGDGTSLRAAVERERLSVETLTGAARGLLTSEGHELSPTIVERVTETLHAAALDGDARRQVTDGRLERELRHIGLGVAAGTPAPAPVQRTPAPKRTAEARKQPDADRGLEREARRRVEREARRRVEREARRRVERAERGAELALERHGRAAEALEAAEAELAGAQAELREAKARLSELSR